MIVLHVHKSSITCIRIHTLQIFLGHFERRFENQKVTDMIARLKKSLEAISNEIQRRNEDLDMPYTGMLPETIPNSITI